MGLSVPETTACGGGLPESAGIPLLPQAEIPRTARSMQRSLKKIPPPAGVYFRYFRKNASIRSKGMMSFRS